MADNKIETKTIGTLALDVLNYAKAGFPLLAIKTYEEARAEKELIEAAKGSKSGIFFWSITKGWVGHDLPGHEYSKRGDATANTPQKAVEWLLPLDPKTAKAPEDCLFVMRDFHPYMEAPAIVRKVRDLVMFCKSTARTVIFLSPTPKIPVELEKEITLLDYPLPTKEELGRILDLVVESVGEKKAAVKDRGRLLEAARGLTETEAENTLALALIKHGTLGNEAIPTVQHEKANIIKKNGVLEFYEPSVSFGNVGGLNEYKRWIQKRQKALTDEARAFGLPVARGVLLVGVQGCGKSLTAKATAALLGIPLLRFDVGRVFGHLVGESESGMRRALAIAEAVSPCVLWLDEMEKGLSGIQSSGRSDGGVVARVFGYFLSWMSEKTAPVFVIATVNDIDALPAEMVRKGRFDDIFFVDLPNELERREIFEIAIKEVNRNPQKFNLEKFAQAADQFSGAEIKEAVVSGLHDAYFEDRELSGEDVLAAIKDTSPLAELTREDGSKPVMRLREKAKLSKWRNATEVISKGSKEPMPRGDRQIRA